MICKNCGGETSTVFCEHCGINVVWYNKYGILQNETEPEKITDAESENDISDNIDDILSEMFIPDGSGD
jgi:uncharacterized protein YegJ (DUF2314 family)